MQLTVLIVIWYIGSVHNTAVAMQEFSSMQQCQHAAKLINERGNVDSAFCINK